MCILIVTVVMGIEGHDIFQMFALEAIKAVEFVGRPGVLDIIFCSVGEFRDDVERCVTPKLHGRSNTDAFNISRNTVAYSLAAS